MKRLLAALFILMNMSGLSLSAQDCPVLDIMPSFEIIQQADCRDCRCLNNSFPQLSDPRLKMRHLSSMQGQLQHRFIEKSIPQFVQQFSEFSHLTQECSLNQLQNVQCPQAKETASMVINTILNQKENKTCFPDRTIERISLKAKRNLNSSMQSIDNNADHQRTLNDYAMLFAESKGIQQRFQKYDDLMKYLEGPDQQEDFRQFVGQQCQQFFVDMNHLFCQPLEEFPTHAPEVQQHFFKVDTQNEKFTAPIEQSGLEVFALTCKQRQACLERQDQCIGIEPLSDPFFKRRPEMMEVITPESSESWSAQLEQYCSLLTCKDIESAMDVILGFGSCEPMTPQRKLSEVIEHFGCQKETELQDDICHENPIATLLKEYNPIEDEEIRVASHTFTLEDLGSTQMKEHLINLGHKPSFVDSLGEIGLAQVFGLPVPIEVSPQAQETKIEEFIAVGAQDAKQAISVMQSEAQESQKLIASQTRDVLQQRRKAQNTIRRPQTNENGNKSVTSAAPDEMDMSDSELRESLVSNFNEAMEAARQAVGTTSRSLDKVREIAAQNSNLSLPEASSSIPPRPRENTARSVPVTSPPRSTRSISSNPASDVTIDRNSQQPLGVPDQARPQEWYQSREEVLPPTSANAEVVSNDENLVSDAIRPRSVGGASGGPSRGPASVDPSNTSDRYVERAKEELPLLTLNDLDRIDLQRPFILGLRDGASLMRIEFIPVEYEGEIRFRVATHQRDQISPAILQTLMTSPFFKRYLHPDLIQSAQLNQRSGQSAV